MAETITEEKPRCSLITSRTTNQALSFYCLNGNCCFSAREGLTKEDTPCQYLDTHRDNGDTIFLCLHPNQSSI